MNNRIRHGKEIMKILAYNHIMGIINNPVKSNLLKRIVYPAAFFSFICFIIYQADTAHYNFAFRMVGKVPYGDKIGHIVLYGFMAFLLNYGLDGKKWFKFHIGSLLVLVFSVVEEMSQAYFPSRSFDYADILASVTGITSISTLRSC